MTCGKQAKERTKARALIVAGLTILEGYQNNDLRLNSLVNRCWKISKYVLKNNEPARKDLATVIGCKLREYW